MDWAGGVRARFASFFALAAFRSLASADNRAEGRFLLLQITFGLLAFVGTSNNHPVADHNTATHHDDESVLVDPMADKQVHGKDSSKDREDQPAPPLPRLLHLDPII